MGPFDELTAAQRQQIREAHASRKTGPTVIRGTCRVCNWRGLLLEDGKLTPHTTPAGTPPGRCKGSGQRPKEGE